jgi:2TM domain
MSESGDTRRQQPSYPEHVTSDDRDGARNEARRWVRRKRIFYTVVGVYLALSLMWFTIDMLDDSTSLWFYWPMLGTGLVVVVTGLVLFGLGGLFGADWERRQVDKYLERRSDRGAGRTLGPDAAASHSPRGGGPAGSRSPGAGGAGAQLADDVDEEVEVGRGGAPVADRRA